MIEQKVRSGGGHGYSLEKPDHGPPMFGSCGQRKPFSVQQDEVVGASAGPFHELHAHQFPVGKRNGEGFQQASAPEQPTGSAPLQVAKAPVLLPVYPGQQVFRAIHQVQAWGTCATRTDGTPEADGRPAALTDAAFHLGIVVAHVVVLHTG